MSAYLNSLDVDKEYSEGYTGADTYKLPLHVLSIVPGHTIGRLALRRTETTADCIDDLVSCHSTMQLMDIAMDLLH
jgi:hypothetical protein